MLANLVRSYQENGYNVVIKPKGRPKHDSQRKADQAGKSSLMSSELEAYRRDRRYILLKSYLTPYSKLEVKKVKYYQHLKDCLTQEQLVVEGSKIAGDL
ncbi:hypothetical protein [Lactobacillus sp. ESL0681]|uniref:hypothetical protein n=1 Tax=Lactobacillus sp. ESL0681 TaxID=2983211 RepID=UPI0023F7216B|nr:hypothetical protein [Lactobacillus sp. ESL0681]WEV39608.1 hypothetical protein OZX59_05170 [Lactobacillus sp. ESL0681]